MLNAASAFAGGRERRALMDAIIWDTKVCFHEPRPGVELSSNRVDTFKAFVYEAKREAERG
jgi:hypothetical protein